MIEEDGFLYPNNNYDHSDLVNFADYLKIPFAGYMYSSLNNYNYSIYFDDVEYWGAYLSSTPTTDNYNSYVSTFNFNNSSILNQDVDRYNGYSVRCFKDEYMNTTYTLTFDSQGGSAVTGQTVLSGEVRTRPYRPTNSGYYFA